MLHDHPFSGNTKARLCRFNPQEYYAIGDKLAFDSREFLSTSTSVDYFGSTRLDGGNNLPDNGGLSIVFLAMLSMIASGHPKMRNAWSLQVGCGMTARHRAEAH